MASAASARRARGIASRLSLAASEGACADKEAERAERARAGLYVHAPAPSFSRGAGERPRGAIRCGWNLVSMGWWLRAGGCGAGGDGKLSGYGLAKQRDGRWQQIADEAREARTMPSRGVLTLWQGGARAQRSPPRRCLLDLHNVIVDVSLVLHEIGRHAAVKLTEVICLCVLAACTLTKLDS